MAPLNPWLAELPRVYSGSAVLVTDEHGRVLLLEASFRKAWLLPGGCLSDDEDPKECARRELAEETGLDLPIGALLDVDWRGADPREEHLAAPVAQFLFDGGSIPADTPIVLDHESLSARWCTLPEAKELLPDVAYDRLRRALDARRNGGCGYGVSPAGAWG
ncbi:MAG TPA: NUDIX hydrolase [Yinghuangia sp.]|uniref:NUDIX domain-containing protein n=1 Tax=Yinghuangia sp. YIM S10712 TaxID=3436930 RepID=UPI002C946A2D|nr:NUDIX hydrolase [Yinghuangia sp.]